MKKRKGYNLIIMLIDLPYRLKMLSNSLILAMLLYNFLIIAQPVSNCTTMFYADGISEAQLFNMDIYHKKSRIVSAASCADYCGLESDCLSAIFNHDRLICMLTKSNFINCSLSAKRYNTFHLKTDGAESLSIITCIVTCKKDNDENFRISRKLTTSNNGFKLAAKPIVPSVITFNGDENHPVPILKDEDDFLAKSSLSKDAKTLSDKIVPQRPIVPINYPLPPPLTLPETFAHSFDVQPHNDTKFAGKSEHYIAHSDTRSPYLQFPKVHDIIKKIVRGHLTIENNLENIKQNENVFEDHDKLKEKEFLKTINQFKPKQENATINGSLVKHSFPELGIFDNKINLKTGKINFLPLKTCYNRYNAQRQASEKIIGNDSKAKKKKQENIIIPSQIISTRFLTNEQRNEPFIKNNSLTSTVVRTSINGSMFEVYNGEFVSILKPTEFTDQIREFQLANNSNRLAASRQNIKENVDDSGEKAIKTEFKNLTVKKDIQSIQRDVKQLDIKNAEPEIVVINGKILTGNEKFVLLRHERTTSTTTTTAAPWRPAGLIGESTLNEPEIIESNNYNIEHPREAFFKSSMKRRGPTFDDDKGFMNTFIIHGLSSLINEKKEKNAITTTTTTTIKPFIPKEPVVCFRSIVQQNLLHASFAQFENFTLNQCRCACADTWKNSTREHCKSLQYKENTSICVLNHADHNGKHDLIYDKYVNYYYVSCQIGHLLSSAKRRCNSKKTKSLKKNSNSTINKENAKTLLTTIVNSTKTSTTTFIPFSTTTVISKISTSTITNSEKNKIETLLNTMINEKSPVFNNTPKNIVEEIDLNGKLRTENDSKVVNVKKNEATIIMLPKATIQNYYKTTITTEKTTPESLKTTNVIIAQQKTNMTLVGKKTTKPENKRSSIQSDVCFEVIKGYAMNGTAGGLEHDVTLEECQCHCANSLISKRYSFQCSSATYYHKENDCILNLANRQMAPYMFVQNSLQDEPDSQITYLGLICNATETLRRNVDNELKNKCGKMIELLDNSENLKSRHILLSMTTAAPHTDDCFLELPNYVLEGIALAIETNVTVDECKCYCIDAENRYGSICQSLQYYYDSQTCLLNKENRITNANQFTYSNNNVMHSYFDYRCLAEKMTLSMYVEQVCQITTQLSTKDIFKDRSALLNIDEKFKETRKLLENASKNKEKNGKNYENTSKTRNTTTKTIIISKKSHPKNTLNTSKSISTTTAITIFRNNKFKNNEKIHHLNEFKNTTIKTVSIRKLEKDNNNQSEYEEEEENEEDNEALNGSYGEEDGNENKIIDEYEEEKLRKQNSKKLNFHQHVNEKFELDNSLRSSDIKVVKPKNLIDSNYTLQHIDTNINSGIAELDEVDDITTTISPRISKSTKIYSNKHSVHSQYSSSSTNSPKLFHSTISAKLFSIPSSKSGNIYKNFSGNYEFTTATPTNTTEFEKSASYPPVGECQYSALYQTIFNGFRLIKRIMVTSPTQCFAACHAERCRSANLVQIEGNLKYCELFKDSIVDFRRTDVLGFDRGAVHFDSIKCEPISTEN